MPFRPPDTHTHTRAIIHKSHWHAHRTWAHTQHTTVEVVGFPSTKFPCVLPVDMKWYSQVSVHIHIEIQPSQYGKKKLLLLLLLLLGVGRPLLLLGVWISLLLLVCLIAASGATHVSGCSHVNLSKHIGPMFSFNYLVYSLANTTFSLKWFGIQPR